MSEEANEIRDLQRQVTQWHGVLLFIITSVLVVLIFANVVPVWVLPKIEKIFEDMLGSRTKLPLLTQWVLGYRHLAGGLIAFTSVITIPLLAIFLLLFLRRSITTAIIAAIVALLMTLHLVVVCAAMVIPLANIVTAINTN